MPVSFGFSVGEIVAGVNQRQTPYSFDSAQSFSETRGAKADYRELQRELISPKNLLDGIQTLSLE